jgi:hypothetical protein
MTKVSLRDSLCLLVQSKLMAEREEELWCALIERMNEEQLGALWYMFEEEHREFKVALSSLEAYLAYIQVVRERRVKFLRTVQQDAPLSDVASALLIPEKQFSEKEIDDALSKGEENLMEYLVNLSVVQLEYCKEAFHALCSQGKIPTVDHTALQDFLTRLQGEVFEKEKESAGAMQHVMESVATAVHLHAQIAQLKQIQASLS